METIRTERVWRKKPRGLLIILAVWFATAALASDIEGKNLPLIRAWSGDYPVSQFNRLPEMQRTTRVGYLGNSAIFADVWHAFQPGEKVPEVDFGKNLVVFSRNVDFYNRTSIAKVVLKDGVVEILAIETRSAIPIGDKVAMAMAVIPREGVKFIQAGKERIAVASVAPPGDPWNTSYRIEGQEVRLIDGHHEKPAAPGSATEIKTRIFGEPVYGDLEGDGEEDAAVFILEDPGGSGTFFYVAAALKRGSVYRGTNAVFLGDRIAPQTLEIRNGVVAAHYAGRRPDEPMAAPPSVQETRYLTVEGGRLEAIKPLREGEEVVGGWVTIGHEVRRFQPCSRGAELWILGDSPASGKIIRAHRKALPDRKRYAPLFMVLAGRVAGRPAGGYGREYKRAFFAAQLVKVWPRGNCKSDRIVLERPKPGAMVSSPLIVRGQARGTWFFEGDFPLLLKDSEGNVVARGFASARGEWMAREFVPFEGKIEFKKPKGRGRGTLILKKDNPSDRPELDDALEIPVFFE